MASIIVGTAASGVLFLAVLLFMARGMEWRSYEFSFGREAETPGQTLGRYLGHPAVWALGFFLLVFLTAGVALAAVGALPLPVPSGPAAAGIVAGVVLLVAVELGIYQFLRSRDRSAAEAVAVGILVFGGLMLVLFSANLVFGVLGG